MIEDVRGPAIVLAHRGFQTSDGKTAHGLVRGGERFQVLAVVDPELAGQDAGRVLDGRRRGIPCVDSVEAALRVAASPPRFCVIGMATLGGRLSAELRAAAATAVDRGLSLVNGLHALLSADPELSAAAARRGVQLIDIRAPVPRAELHFWSGEIHQVSTPRVAVLGMDCSIGKRTTTRLLVTALRRAGVRAEMIYTGQTGWMQGAEFGILLDALPNDFVSGELEHAIVSCARTRDPRIMVIEGQSSLRNPSGPCGAELLLSAAVHGVILQHAPGRRQVDDFEHLDLRLPSVESEIDLIAAYGVPTLAITLNSQGVTATQLAAEQERLETRLGIPVIRPLEDGVDALVPLMRKLMARVPA